MATAATLQIQIKLATEPDSAYINVPISANDGLNNTINLNTYQETNADPLISIFTKTSILGKQGTWGGTIKLFETNQAAIDKVEEALAGDGLIDLRYCPNGTGTGEKYRFGRYRIGNDNLGGGIAADQEQQFSVQSHGQFGIATFS